MNATPQQRDLIANAIGAALDRLVSAQDRARKCEMLDLVARIEHSLDDMRSLQAKAFN